MLIDNVNTKEIKWSDFELEGNKENLISQGWDSFEPYGFGEFIEKAPEEVFDDNYAQNELLNGDFRNGIESWRTNLGDIIVENKICEYTFDAVDYGNYIRQDGLGVFEDNVFYISFYFNPARSHRPTIYNGEERTTFSETAIASEFNFVSSTFVGLKDRIFIYANGFNPSGVDVGDVATFSNIKLINLTKIFGTGNEPTKEWCDENLKYYPNWQDLTEEEKPVEAYENGFIYRQELNNGLMRVKTKGGSDETKFISPNLGTIAGLGTDLTLSLYAENSGESDINLSNNNSIEGVPYPSGDNYTIAIPINYNGGAYLKGVSKGTDVELSVSSIGDIDMVVSNHEVVLGNEPNATMFIDELEDGREHVQIHNINVNTKLTYTDYSTIKGEPYTIETKIENDGRVFNLVANMLDEKIEVKKGLNSINKYGELNDKDLRIEVEVD